MNKLTIIGNLVRDPELRTTTTGKEVCSFTVAVNRRKRGDEHRNDQPEADFFRVTAWEGLARICNQYLAKGRKVAVIGSVSLNLYTNSKGENSGSLEVSADDVEFLSPKGEQVDEKTGYKKVDPDDLPY